MEKKQTTIFDIIESEEIENQTTLPSESSYINKEEDINDETNESCILSSFNYFGDSKINNEEYFMDESEIDNKSSFDTKNEKDKSILNNIYNNSTYKESEFIKISRLGKGSYGQAFKIKHKETNKIYAVKELNKSKLIKENKFYQIKVENDMLRLCSHSNIVKYYGFYENQSNFSIVEEYCPFGDLASFILENKQNLTITEIQYIIGQIISCLEYLSSQKIIHRDIKPENFLITYNFKLKLIDFGTATFLGQIFDTETNNFIDENLKTPKRPADSFIISNKYSEEQNCYFNNTNINNNSPYSSFRFKASDISKILEYPFPETEKNNSIKKFEDIKRQKFVGTAEYMSPETINSKKIGYYTDMWSMICILYLCFTGHTPFSDKTEYLIFQNIITCKYNEENINLINEEALDLIKKFFKIEPSERIGYKGEKDFDFNKIKSHPFFILKEKNINLSNIKEQLINKCSYYKKFLEKIKNKENKKNKIQNNANIENNDKNDDDKNDEEYFNQEVDENKGNDAKNGNEIIIKSGLLKKQSPYFYYDLRKVILYNTPRLDYIDPDKSILKGSINLTKECSAKLIRNNQFKLITPQRTFIFMCKERYDITPWVNEINKAIEKYNL